jgi:nicotinamidase-related amidase
VTRRALIVVDVQRGFLGSVGDGLPGRIAGYARRHRGRYALVVATRFVNHAGSRYVIERDWSAMIDQRETALAPEIAAVADVILPKHGLAPDGHQLATMLRAARIGRADLCGLDTDQCVLATALQLWDAGIVPRVLSDLCTSSGGEELHDAARALLRRSIGDRNVVESEDLRPDAPHLR